MEKIVLGVAGLAIVLFGGYWVFSMSSVQTVTPAIVSQATTTTDTNAPGQATTSPVTPVQSSTLVTTNTTNQQPIMHATLHTSLGDITFEFLPSDAPNAVANFIKLAQAGFYNGTKFHRVIKGFMDQGGDPLTKDDTQMARWGTGGPGYQFADENLNAQNNVGIVAMANSGPNTNGSQFFINVVNNNFLDGKYTVFAKVTAGMDVANAINNTPTDSSDRPVTAVVVTSVTVSQ